MGPSIDIPFPTTVEACKSKIKVLAELVLFGTLACRWHLLPVSSVVIPLCVCVLISSHLSYWIMAHPDDLISILLPLLSPHLQIHSHSKVLVFRVSI
jgi:hypothetical protein